MKHLLVVALVVLCGCSKDPEHIAVTVQAKCLRCAVEYTAEGVTHRDTLLWNLVRLNGDVFDTVATTGKWNLVLEKGAPVSIRACRLDVSDDTGPASVWITEATERRVDALFPDACAVLDHSVQ